MTKLKELLANATKKQKIIIGVALGVVVLLVGSALVFAGGGGDDEPEAAATTTTSTTRPPTTTTTAPPVAPLTGLPQADAAKLERPALIVKVDNVPAAFGLQEGVEAADVVYVEEVEGAATRMAVVYQSLDETVGPVRSARTSDLEIAGNLNMPFFAYSGANGGVLQMVADGPMIDEGINRSEAQAVYSRNQRGRGLHRFFLPTNEIYEIGRPGGSTPPPLFTYRAEGTPSTGEIANAIDIGYGSNATRVHYDWDAATGWKRSQNGKAHVMADSGIQITPKNVVVQFVPYSASAFVDVSGARSPEAEMVGEGEAWVFSDGKLVRGRWSRPSLGAVTAFTDAAGQPIQMTPGQTFVELVPAPGSFLGQGSVTIA
jgi:hypothetical protein